ncbi:hypothetical protein BH11BAC7_BH11BAC7_33050 [soil metagenome]
MNALSNNKFFFLTWEESINICVANSSQKAPLDHILIPLLEGKNELPFDFILNGEPQDYLPNNMAWPLMSEKMKQVIERNLTGHEKISWISTNVKAGEDVFLYYVIRFDEKMDVLDLNRTTFVPGTDQIIRPCFSFDKVKKYNLFHKPGYSWRITPAVYISETLKNEIEKENLSGVDFEKVMVA